MPLPLAKKHLTASSLIRTVANLFKKVSCPRGLDNTSKISIQDHLMSGLAVFGLKCPSLLDYDRKRRDAPTAHNLKTLYHVEAPPSDTYLRQRLDEVDPINLRKPFTKLFSIFQRGKGLEKYAFLDNHVLLSVDGTGHFSSSAISCPCCCTKQQNGKTTFYHQLFAGCIVHPERKNVIPLCPEAIMNQDGNNKNDCERNAFKRFLEHFRREHPHLQTIVVADGISSTAPNINLLNEFNLKYILGAKPGDHAHLFDQLHSTTKAEYHELRTKDGELHQFYFANGVELNKSNPDTLVNVLEYRHTDHKGKVVNFSWVTNIKIDPTNVMKIAEGGRARWRIENATFNTLKNLGNNFEHNYGHGKQHLATNFALLMMLSFLIDQILEACCDLFKRAKQKRATYVSLWESMRALFTYVAFSCWEDFYRTIIGEKFLTSS